MSVARVQTLVQLSDELLDQLDAEAARRGVSRSALVREAVRALLAEARGDAVTDAIVAGYRRVPPQTPDAWGDLEAERDRSTAETLLRLDAEERAAGLEPW
jgi:Arc/MetJ-type ribon-helix-helix transcriptional regulator